MSVSIVIPVYNVEKYLSKCLESVCAQANCVKEIILVNDGSTDGSLNICIEYAKRDARIKIINKDNEGVSAAIIDGVKEATCDYVGFIDSDDYVEPNMFEELFKSAYKNGADIAICTYDSEDENGNRFWIRDLGVNEDGVFLKHDGKFDIPILPTFQCGKFISSSRWNKIFKRELVVNNIAFKKVDVRVGEDLALVIPVVMSANRIAYVNKCLYHYLQRSGSIVHTYKRQNIDDWQSVNEIIYEAAIKYDYKLEKFDETKLSFLLYNCLSKLRYSNLNFVQKKIEYKYIGNNDVVRQLLNKTKIVGTFKRKIVFRLIKYKLYGLLSLIY